MKWQKRYEETGLMDRIIPTVTRPRKVDYNKVEEFIEKHPDKTLKEIGEKFKISAFATYKIIRKLDITYKKTLPLRVAQRRFVSRISKNLKSNSPRKSALS